MPSSVRPLDSPARTLIVPDAPSKRGDDEAESPDVWGFRDTHFDVNENGNVIIRGSRYELSGKELPRFLPWVREILEVDVNARDVHAPHYPTTVPEPILAPDLCDALKK